MPDVFNSVSLGNFSGKKPNLFTSKSIELGESKWTKTFRSGVIRDCTEGIYLRRVGTQMIKRYRVIVREPIPSNLRERVSDLHASALLKSRDKRIPVDVTELKSHNSEVTLKGDKDKAFRKRTGRLPYGNKASDGE